jgi:DNA-binding protein YbaB
MMTKTPYGLYAFTHKDLERFAALVAAAEREACAKVCEERQEVFQKYYTKGLAAMCAEAIRARGKQ